MQYIQMKCENCSRSLLRNLRGAMTLYCGYFMRPIPDYNEACDHWNEDKEKPKP